MSRKPSSHKNDHSPKKVKGMVHAGRALLRQTLGAVRRQAALCIAFGLAWQAVAVAVPWVLEQAVDDGILAADRGALVAWSAVLVLLGVVRWAGDAARHWWVERAGAHAVSHLRRRLVRRLLSMDDQEMARFGHGDLTSRAVGDTQKIWNWVSGVATLVTSGFTLAAVLVLLVTLDPGLALVGLGTVPLAALFAARQVRRHGAASVAAAEGSGAFTGAVESAIAGIRTVKGLGSERKVLAWALESSAALRDRMMSLARVEAWWLAVAVSIPGAGIAAGLWLGGNRVLEGALSVGSLVAFAGWMGLLVDATITFSERLTDRGAALAAAGRLAEVLESGPAPGQPPGPYGQPSGRDLSADGLAARRGGRLVFSNLDLDVREGEWLAVAGPTGSGKTTLLRLLGGLDAPVVGRVRFGGTDLAGVDPQVRRAAAAFVPQGAGLVGGSVAEVLRLADPDAGEEELWRAIRAAQAEDVVAGVGGLEGRIGDRGMTLSGGQRQRIALALALLRRPGLLLLDDTTSALDPGTEIRVLKSLREHLPESTLVVSTHRASTAAACDRVVVLADGGLLDAEDESLETRLTEDEF
jgi:ATP-binding cassette subfamily B protein